MIERGKVSLDGDLKKRLDRVPVLSDRMLVQLVQGIEVNRDLLRYQQRQGFIGRLLGELTGRNAGRELLLDLNLTGGQDALLHWVVELSKTLPVSIVALQEVKTLLFETRGAVRQHRKELEHLGADIDQLERRLEDLASEMGARYTAMDVRLREVELEVRAHQDLDLRVSAWEAGTYAGLPWIVQAALLTREIFSGAVAIYERESSQHNRLRFRGMLASKFIARFHFTRSQPLVLAGLLDEAAENLASEDLEMSVAIMDVRSRPIQRARNQKYLFTLGTTLELAGLPSEVRPPSPGGGAWALCRTQVGDIERLVSLGALVEAIVDETADECLAILDGATDS